MQQRFPFHNEAPPGFEWVYRPWITDPKTGQRRYPKRARVFKLLVPKAK
jgi:hypothetical protein